MKHFSCLPNQIWTMKVTLPTKPCVCDRKLSWFLYRRVKLQNTIHTQSELVHVKHILSLTHTHTHTHTHTVYLTLTCIPSLRGVSAFGADTERPRWLRGRPEGSGVLLHGDGTVWRWSAGSASGPGRWTGTYSVFTCIRSSGREVCVYTAGSAQAWRRTRLPLCLGLLVVASPGFLHPGERFRKMRMYEWKRLHLWNVGRGWWIWPMTRWRVAFLFHSTSHCSNTLLMKILDL